MNIWHDISAKRITPGNFISVIEISRGSKRKCELDKETGLLILDRILYTSTQYPANYGFIPRTLSDDGDPLDVLVVCSEPIEPMTLVKTFPIGAITMQDNGREDEKIIALPYYDPNYSDFSDISDLPKHIFDEMRHFFAVYKALETRETVVDQVMHREDAERIIQESIDRYIDHFCR